MKRIHSYSYIRTIACIGIIFIHVLTSGIAKYNFVNSDAADVAYRSVVNCLKWGVPCFIMISGMLLLNPQKKITISYLFKRYIKRIILATVIFGLIFTILDFIFSGDLTAGNFLAGLYEIFSGGSWSHLWYLYCLIGIYLLLPFYKMITGCAKEQEIRYLLIVYVIFLSIVPLMNGFGIECGFYIHVSSIYPFWFFYGYYMKQWGFKKSRMFYLGLAFFATLILILFTVIRWSFEIEAIDALFNYSSFIVILQSTGVIGFLYKLEIKEGSRVDRVLLNIDKHSFGIYLTHMIAIWIAYTRIDWNPFLHGGFIGILILAAAAFFSAYIIDILLRKLPLFSEIL